MNIPGACIPKTLNLTPSGDIGIENVTYPLECPCEIWTKIFSYLPHTGLKLFTGFEDTNRLMVGQKFIFNKKDFMAVVNEVYNLALCCKAFYLLTERERDLLIEVGFYDPMPLISPKEQPKDLCEIYPIFESHLLKNNCMDFATKSSHEIGFKNIDLIQMTEFTLPPIELNELEKTIEIKTETRSTWSCVLQ